MANASFGMYIVHYPIVLVICYTLDRLNVPSLLAYALALAAELLLTPLFYEGLKRIPVIRLLVLGIK